MKDAAATACPKCGRSNPSDAVICAACDYILDTSFLGEDILDEAVRYEEHPPAYGGDALILGNVERTDEFSTFESEKTGDFLIAPTSAGIRALSPSTVYMNAETRALLEPEGVLAFKDGVVLTDVALSPFEAHVATFIDGKRPVARVGALAGLGEEDLRICLALLVDKNLLQRVGTATRAEAGPSIQDTEFRPLPPEEGGNTSFLDEDTDALDSLPASLLDENIPAGVDFDASAPGLADGPSPFDDDYETDNIELPSPEPSPPDPRPITLPPEFLTPIASASAAAPAAPPPGASPPAAAAVPALPGVVPPLPGVVPALPGQAARPPAPEPPAPPPPAPPKAAARKRVDGPGRRLVVKDLPPAGSPAPAPDQPTEGGAGAPKPQTGAHKKPPKPLSHDQLKAKQIYELAIKDIRENRIVRAMGYAKLAAELDPGNEAYRDLLENWHEARAIAERAERDASAGGGASGGSGREDVRLFHAAKAAEQRGDFDAAIAALEKAVKASPRAAQLHNQLGVLLATRRKDMTRALDHLFKAVELDSSNPAYKNNLGKVMAMADALGEAPSDDEKKGKKGWLKGLIS